MSVSLKLENQQFNRALTRLVSEVGPRKMLREINSQVGVLVKNAVMLTPPTGSSPMGESPSIQRQAGYDAIEKDIRGKFKPFPLKIRDPRMKLGYIFKDELSDGIDNQDSTTAHLHFLLSDRHLKKGEFIKKIISGLWTGKRKIPRFGLCSVKRFDDSKKIEGISYTVKTRKFNTIIFNGLDISHSLKKEITYHQQHVKCC